ncbi:hypothetical protein OJAV_G00060760 [Oryzias javanicus]|uniref:Chemokine interleukin-8-like domain-containing protein n=1 Tax=Oryzias javanicus TaxID=123683 RepID=A0A437DBL4_ORYJA|nr:hypothetical protein OJAV_G00060760 [Oryzias javanicus]
MKTLLLLLLLAACCHAIPAGVSCTTTPLQCCLNFSQTPVPIQKVKDITKTSSCCTDPAFIVKTTADKEICYKEDFQQVRDIFNILNRLSEGSG